MKDKQQSALQCSDAAFSATFIIHLVNFSSLFFCEEAFRSIYVRFKMIWRNVLGSLSATPVRLYLASHSRGGVYGSLFLKSRETLFLFPCNPSYLAGSNYHHLAASSYTSVVALRGFAWCSEAAVGCQTLALCQSSEAGPVALFFWASGSISLISSVLFEWSCKGKQLSPVPRCTTLFSHRKEELFILSVFQPVLRDSLLFSFLKIQFYF